MNYVPICVQIWALVVIFIFFLKKNAYFLHFLLSELDGGWLIRNDIYIYICFMRNKIMKKKKLFW